MKKFSSILTVVICLMFSCSRVFCDAIDEPVVEQNDNLILPVIIVILALVIAFFTIGAIKKKNK